MVPLDGGPAFTDDRWSHIDPDELRALWLRHAPDFIRHEQIDRHLRALRASFLEWLEQEGVELAPGERRERIGKRVRLVRVHVTWDGGVARADVSMMLDSKSVEVNRTGSGALEETARLCAEAALQAVQELIPSLSFHLEHALLVDLPEPPTEGVALVLVREAGRSAHAPEVYVGACRASSPVPEVVAKATLDAINRRAERALAESLQEPPAP